jgi:hypothetical protein
LLKGVNDAAATSSASDAQPKTSRQQATVELEQDDSPIFPAQGTVRTASEDLSPDAQVPFTEPIFNQPGSTGTDSSDWQLMELGLSEAPPPWEVIEEL